MKQSKRNMHCMSCGILQFFLCMLIVSKSEAQITFSCQGNSDETINECFLRSKMYRIANDECREKCAWVPSVAQLFGWKCGTCNRKISPTMSSPVSSVAPARNPVKTPSIQTPATFPVQQPVSPPSTPTGIKKCGGAVNTGGSSANATCLSDLWTPTQDMNMHCYAYGGNTDPCALHNNNDMNDGLFKSPSKCDRDTFYLWDEPDTQGKSYTWAGQEWLKYANRYSADIQKLRERGVKFTSPLLRAGEPGVTASNLNQFYVACGAPCRDRNSPAYININAVNVFVGPWNVAGIQGCRDAAIYMVNEIKAYYPTDNLPWYITNWSRLGTYNISDQVDAMDVVQLFFQNGSPIQRIYWFGATDYGGNSGNNFLTQPTLDGRTLGQIWKSKCDTL